jgi:hypothetical protein
LAEKWQTLALLEDDEWLIFVEGAQDIAKLERDIKKWPKKTSHIQHANANAYLQDRKNILLRKILELYF